MSRHFFQRLRANVSSVTDLCNATVTDALSVYNGALSRYVIDQTSSTISIENEDYAVDKEVISSNEAFTISFWLQVHSSYLNSDGTREVYIASSDTEQCIKLYTETDNSLYLSIFDTYNNKDFVRWKLKDSGGNQYITSGLLASQMNHFMITRESVFIYLYVNGKYNDDIEVGDSAEFPIFYYDSIGKFTASNDIKISTCYLDDFAVFNGAFRTKEVDIEVPTTYIDLYANYIDGHTVFLSHFDDNEDPLKYLSTKISMFLEGDMSFIASNSADIGISSDHNPSSIYTPGEGGSLKSLNSLNDFICLFNSQLSDEVTYDFKFKVKTDSSSSTIDPFDSGMVNYILNDNNQNGTTILSLKPTNDNNEIILGAKSYTGSTEHTIIENTTIETQTSTRQWNHCAITIKKEENSQRTFSIFLNGKMVFSASNIIDVTSLPTVEFYFGLSNTDSMTSLIDELRVSDVIRYDSTGFTPETMNYDLDYPIVLDGEKNEWLDDSNIHPALASSNETSRSVKREFDDIEFDTALLSAVEKEESFDTKIIVCKDFDIDNDTKRTVFMDVDELSETERKIVKDAIDNADTKFTVHMNELLDSETRRSVAVSSLESYDTKLVIYRPSILTFDTERTVKTNKELDYDTSRSVKKEFDDIEFDTNRLVGFTNEDEFNTKRIVKRTDEYEFNTSFTVKTNKEVDSDTSISISKDMEFEFDTNRSIGFSNEDEFNTKRLVKRTDEEEFNTSLSVKTNKELYSDTLYKTSITDEDEYETSRSVTKTINVKSETERFVKALRTLRFDTRLVVIKDGEPIPVDEIKAKHIRVIAFARSGSVNFMGMTGDSHHYYWVSAELIKTILERGFLVYERLVEPDENGNTEVQITLDNYDKPTGGQVITDADIPALSVVPNFEEAVARMHEAEMEEHLRRKGLDIKAQQDELINS